MSELVVISGPSGVGKGTVVKELQRLYEENGERLYLSVSCTTRMMRPGEVEGESYYFISLDEFETRLSNGGFLEYNQYGTGKYYGTPLDNVLEHLENGDDVILEIDVNGYRQVKEKISEAVGIFIAPPSIEEVENRLRTRGTETEEVINRRLAIAKAELKTQGEYDYVVINENGKQVETAKKVYDFIKGDKQKKR